MICMFLIPLTETLVMNDMNVIDCIDRNTDDLNILNSIDRNTGDERADAKLLRKERRGL